MVDYKKMIKEKGLKQTWVAAKIGIGSSALSMFLSGKMNLEPEKRRKLDKLLGVG